MIQYRFALPQDDVQLAEMKWQHALEDSRVYHEPEPDPVGHDRFVQQFCSFLRREQAWQILVAEEEGRILSALFLYFVPKCPGPNSSSDCIAYLTNVFTLPAFRSRGIGAALLEQAKAHARSRRCELLFVWPSPRSMDWYCRNGFTPENDLLQCDL